MQYPNLDFLQNAIRMQADKTPKDWRLAWHRSSKGFVGLPKNVWNRGE